MEERPSDRAHEKRYHHGGERSSSRTKTSLKNDPSQCQHQETQTKKTGNGRINGSAVERECATRPASDSVGVAYSANANGHQAQLDAAWKPKQSGRAPPAISKPGSRGGVGYRNGIMGSRNDRSPDLLAPEGKKEPAPLPNGVSVPLGFFTNGYPGNKPPPAPDNDGSGSESGYATPRKRKPLRSGAGGKGAESGAQPPPEAPESPAPEPTEKPPGPASRAEARTNKQAPVSAATPVTMAIPPPPTGACEPQRRNFDGKAAGAFGRKQDDRPGKAKSGPVVTATAKEREDSWTLFKPPPVFPVDNSSAKIVPKISYASKVKENLNRAGGEVPPPSGPQSAPPQAPGRPAQVPMSAMKTITSSGFANGALCSAEGHAYSLTGTLFASTVPPENVAPPADEGGGVLDGAVAEPRKPSLFVYPLAPSSSNMQLALPSGRQADPPVTAPHPAPAPGSDPSSAPANQKALGDIFQNQWGLSFINDPSAGPEGGAVGAGAERVPGTGAVAEVTFQGDCPVAPPAPREASEAAPPPPKAHESEKRTSPQTHSSVLKAGPPPAPPPLREGGPQAPGPDGQRDAAEARNLGAIVFASPKDPPAPAEPLGASPTNGAPLLRGPAHPKGLERRCSWGSFDLKAAVSYHTKEMECVLNLQKQDPKRVVLYGETKDGPNQ
ncbi:nuclear fragile X mental retardation-interacting protein 2 isoform X1 [Anguilla anguilla]|uniref:nuclear fragile X mental retardation-interacting protein 2 isoform X1 n=2 Tax=Anguilla anguilla TaxID=7936 RepID=UPI0015AEE40D|nr:nuclear fragile X mental retardation-interacting protein 2 isoform X1 [Anguilla anguilla]